MKRVLIAAILVSAIGYCPRPTSAQNVDLVTLPNRDSVQLTIYNSEDLTLAKEQRFITLKKGDNALQFSWAGTLIDPTSVELRILENADAIEVSDTVYPGQKPQHLIWNIQSEHEGQVPVEVSYFTSGLTWRMDYVAITDPAEDTLGLRGYVRVFNNSGEEYENAEIRMIVGKINLVEKIAQLARERNVELGDESRHRLRHNALRGFAGKAEDGRVADAKEGKKQIVKEGLSEYFMFSVEGQETVRNGWSKRMQAVEGANVSFDIVYRMRSHQYGSRPVRFFIWKNDKEHQLGESPLPNGLVRVFRTNEQGGLSYLGQQALQYVPVQADIEVNLGTDDLVVYERRRSGTRRSDFAFHPTKKHVTGWTARQSWVDSVRNYRDEPIRFELRIRFAGDVQFQSPTETGAFDYNTVESKFDVPARDRFNYSYVATIRHGTNAKQARVRILPPPR